VKHRLARRIALITRRKEAHLDHRLWRTSDVAIRGPHSEGLGSRMNGQPNGSNDPSNAFQNSSSIATHDNLLGSTVFAGETHHIR
jgi:hypothetical protein